MNQAKHLNFSIKKLLLVSLFLVVAVIHFPSQADAAHASDCTDVYTPLSSYVTAGVNNNKEFYTRVMNETGVPWEMLAAIHYRETNFSHSNPSNGQGIFQFVNGEGGPYPAGAVSNNEFVRQLKFMATKIQTDYVSRGSTPRERRQLVANEQNVAIVKDTLFSYNGRASAYANQASHFGYNSTTQPYEGSPYVMNRFDCARARMGIITRDYGAGIDSADTRYGAFTVFARLRGDEYRNSLLQSFSAQLLSSRIYSDSARTQEFTARPTIQPGGKAFVRLKLINTGNQAWDRSFLKLGTDRKRDSSSQIYDTSWLAANRPTQLIENSVSPGNVGTFEFAITGPRAGTFMGYFNLVAEGRTWLNDLGLAYGLNVVNSAAPNSSYPANLPTNATLRPGQRLMSPDGQTVLILQGDGNLIIRRNFVPVWSSGTSGNSPDRLIMQPDGNLVLYNTANSAIWNTGTSSGNNPYLTLQTDGNMVAYSGSSIPLWSTGTISNPNNLNYVNQSLPNGVMYPNQIASTANRKNRLVFQPDGNLVLYSENRAVWSSGTYGRPVDSLVMQSDGNLVMYGVTGSPIWNTGTSGMGISYTEVQEDGNLVIYNNIGLPTWSSGTSGL